MAENSYNKYMNMSRTGLLEDLVKVFLLNLEMNFLQDLNLDFLNPFNKYLKRYIDERNKIRESLKAV